MPEPNRPKPENLRTLDSAFQELRRAVERDDSWEEITRLAQRVVKKALDAKKDAE